MPSGKPEPLLDWQQDEIREAFNLFDADATGKISYNELRAACRSLGYNPRKAELRRMVQEHDSERTGFIDFEGFRKIMKEQRQTVDLISEIDAVFQLLAGDRDSISLSNLREAAKEIGENMTTDDIEEMVEMISSDTKGNSTGVITKEQFRRIMSPKGTNDDLEDLDQ